MPDVVVVGGGLAGLVAARDLANTGREVLLLEGSSRLGGKLRTESVAGLSVDVGAEAVLARRPEALELFAELGEEPVYPTSASSRIWSYGELRRMPRSLMGVPFDVDDLQASGVLSAAGSARARAEVPTLVEGDLSVGDLLAARLGEELVDRLVEPLLGGVYAGHAHEISTAAAVPQLLAMAERGSLLTQAAELPTSTTPVFASLPGGMGRLPALLAGSVDVERSTMVRELNRIPSGWRVNGSIEVEQVVLATPAAATARLLAGVSAVASAEAAMIETASVVVVTMVFRATAIPDRLFDVSGLLVPPIEGRQIKAATNSFAKWDWVRGLDPDVVVLRTSIGRHREVGSIQVDDQALVRASLADLAAMTNIVDTPIATHVQRWGGGLPQYPVGHLDRVARVRAALPEGLAVCGASYDGVGIASVIASARSAVAAITQAECIS